MKQQPTEGLCFLWWCHTQMGEAGTGIWLCGVQLCVSLCTVLLGEWMCAWAVYVCHCKSLAIVTTEAVGRVEQHHHTPDGPHVVRRQRGSRCPEHTLRTHQHPVTLTAFR